MGKLLVFLVGVLAGAAFAHVAARTPRGAALVGAVDAATDEFVRTLSDSYRARLAEAR